MSEIGISARPELLGQPLGGRREEGRLSSGQKSPDTPQNGGQPPFLLFAGWIGYQGAEQGRNDARVAAASTVERAAEPIRAEMMAQIQVAQTLTLSAELPRNSSPPVKSRRDAILPRSA